jgi:tetratricopeptide (TPR) repeat protein
MKTRRVIVLALGFAGCSLSLMAQRMGVDPSQNPFSQHDSAPGFNSTRGDNRSITGTVQDTQNNPLKDVRVELTDANGAVINSTYTNSSGQFEFTRLASGGYVVVATSGLQQATERVDASTFSSMVSIRLRGAGKPEDGVEGNTVTVAQYRVPGKAREEYRKAHDALTKGKIEDARKHLAKALEIFPTYAEALTLRGVLALDNGDSQSAIADLDKAIKADGNYAMAYTVMGSALNMQSKFDEAIRALQRGESLAPDLWQSHFELGKSYIGKADYPAALRHLERAENLTPTEYPLIYLLRAHALLSMKQFPEAMNALQTYLQKDPKGANNQQVQKMLQQAQAFLARKK